MNTNNYSKIKNPEELCDLLGLPKTQAKRAEIKADLAVAISKIINEKGWTHKEASEISGVGRTVITSIVNGNIHRISTDRLIDIASNLGLDLTVNALPLTTSC